MCIENFADNPKTDQTSLQQKLTQQQKKPNFRKKIREKPNFCVSSYENGFFNLKATLFAVFLEVGYAQEMKVWRVKPLIRQRRSHRNSAPEEDLKPIRDVAEVGEPHDYFLTNTQSFQQD